MRQRPKKKLQVRKKRALKRPLRSFKKITIKIRRAMRIPPAVSAPVFEPPARVISAPRADDRLPSHYGDNKLALMVRDPWWLFADWEIEAGRQEAVTREIARNGHKNKRTVLRVYDVTRVSLPKFNTFFDIELNFYSNNWYIDVGLPDREWVAEIGYRTDGGHFYVLARSNRVRTPAFGLSEVLDEEWLLPEDVYYRIIGRTLGAGSQEGSMEIRKLLEKYLRNVMSSERTPNVKPSRTAAAGSAFD